MYRNPEYYPDPTVGRALEDLRRKETRLNTGKQFEADWKSSMQIGRASCRERV